MYVDHAAMAGPQIKLAVLKLKLRIRVYLRFFDPPDQDAETWSQSYDLGIYNYNASAVVG
jgi:hypothetical protein